ncbi:hypothetical protein Acr_00g0017070 [Actinidia rufa]|uniref:Uncharacterized protein n=1 Tax=Actinidia rufa TaxID=165716 RepID=A0A7J0DBN5_9ERIC|nr:hypothetical protein Acr_00g0017070 [Actinidia rufa]
MAISPIMSPTSPRYLSILILPRISPWSMVMAHYSVYKKAAPHYSKVCSTHSTILFRAILPAVIAWSNRHAGGVLSGLAPALYFGSSVQVALQASKAQCRGDRAILTVGCSPRFLPQQFGAVCGNDSSRSSMHLRSRNLPRPSASSPPGNRSHPMANPGQAPDLEGLHREIHDMAEQMRIMNENNGRLMQLLAAANPPLPAAPPVPDIERSRHSNRSGDRSQNISANRVGRGRRQAPSSSLREKEFLGI